MRPERIESERTSDGGLINFHRCGSFDHLVKRSRSAYPPNHVRSSCRVSCVSLGDSLFPIRSLWHSGAFLTLLVNRCEWNLEIVRQLLSRQQLVIHTSPYRLPGTS